MKNENYLFDAMKLVKVYDIPQHIDNRGDLIVLEGEDIVPFKISRVFSVSAPKDSIRGKHAHKKCSQFMVCLAGTIRVDLDDGDKQTSCLLDRSNKGLLIPPGVWAQEVYKEEGSVLMVLCDRPYEKEDYIISIKDLIKYKRSFG